MNSKQRSSLRARAHSLEPVVIVGGEGLTTGVITEIERNLLAHELIKVRVADADRETRDAVLGSICERTGAEPVQHIGKILVVFRPAPPAEPKVRVEPKRKRAAGKKPPKRGSAGALRGRPARGGGRPR
jgi:RNA-binding protein